MRRDVGAKARDAVDAAQRAQLRDLESLVAAWIDTAERLEIHRNVHRKAVIRAVAPNPQADRAELLSLDVDSGCVAPRNGRHAVLRDRVDDGVLERLHERPWIEAEPSQVERRKELLKLVESGMSEQAILDVFVGKHGKVILRKPPAEGFYLVGWIMPFVGVAGGLALIWLVLQQYLSRRPAAATNGTATPAANPELDRYRDKIEKDLADLE